MTAAVATEPQPLVILIDLSSLFWTAWHASGAQEVSAAQRITLENVKRCIGQNDDALVAICCDSGRSFRKDLLPTYKAQRPEKDHASLGELDRVKERLRADGYLLWEAPGFEADDVIATNVEAARALGHDVLICSADKDLLQLVGPGVRALRTHTWTEVGEKEVTERFGVPPAKLGDWLALVGDKSDNVPGAPGIGDKRATALLVKFNNLDALFYTLEADRASVGTKFITDSLDANYDAVMLARKLVALRDDAPIDFRDIYKERRPQPLASNPEVNMETDDMDDESIPISKGPGAPAAPVAEPAKETAGKPIDVVAEMDAPAPTKALTVMPTQPQSFELALEPTSLGVAFKLGAKLYDSRLYVRFGTPEAITAVIMRGREMGLPALTALDSFHVIEGKPAPHAHLITALAERHPDCEYFMLVSSDNKAAEYETKHRRHPRAIRHKYTVQDAIDAGLCTAEIAPRPPMGQKDSRSNWDKRRAEMLRKTCAVQLVRIAYPDRAMGLYSIEELGGDDR
ncbi:MAG TPA: 5'-3' exonuclease H3TH domain-containing protein [Candidatus Dormibacteraeota bacterium]